MPVPTVVITGALTGIGHATAVAYARQGADLVVSGRHQTPGEQLAKELEALGGRATFVRADVRFEADVKNLVTEHLDQAGDRAVSSQPCLIDHLAHRDHGKHPVRGSSCGNGGVGGPE
ncbi:SDR family NAD(P)-dependent oxidoreductase [Streptomyces sp. NPDC001984]